MTMKMFPEKEKRTSKKKTMPAGETKAPFFDAVYAVVRKVPRGRVTTYGAVAEATGMRMSARMVGWALSVCSNAKPRVPAHRVVNRLGILSGRHHFATPTLMQELLEQEGVQVKDDAVADFKKLLWKPGEKK
jgi:methylated-DNA-protein-cysteine methyltransferase-like protein